MPTGSQTLRFLLAVTAFAVYSQSAIRPVESELSLSVCHPVCAWLIANAQIPVFRQFLRLYLFAQARKFAVDRIVEDLDIGALHAG